MLTIINNHNSNIINAINNNDNNTNNNNNNNNNNKVINTAMRAWLWAVFKLGLVIIKSYNR
jgi:hypothetical protein